MWLKDYYFFFCILLRFLKIGNLCSVTMLNIKPDPIYLGPLNLKFFLSVLVNKGNLFLSLNLLKVKILCKVFNFNRSNIMEIK